MAETNRRKTTTSGLPIDMVLYHIAPRLPAKSVFRLMAVSKEFYSFLNTQKFVKMHLHHVTNNHIHKYDKLVVLSAKKPLFGTIDYETPDDLIRPSRPVPFLKAHYRPYMKILTSFHGLVCVGVYQSPKHEWRYSDLILWNPVTGDYKILSRPDYDTRPYFNLLQTFGLYYSSCDDDYKLVHVTVHRGVYMYSLKSDSWRKLVDLTTRPMYTIRSVRSNENLYFLKPYLEGFPFSILKFDTKTEKFTEITTPFLFQLGYEVRNLYVIVHKGCIHLSWRYDGTSRLIVMKNEQDEDWTEVDSCKVLKFDCSKWFKIGKTELDKFSPEKNALADEGRYTETFLSPNQYKNN